MKNEENDFVYRIVFKCTEEEVNELIQVVTDLSEMAQFGSSYLRHKLEKCHPALTELLRKFLTLELARSESLLEVHKMLLAISKEFWIAKYSNQGGAA